MNIYSIKDTMVGYYMPPFCSDSDQGVIAAIAKIVNQGARDEPIYIAPSNFEIWKLGTLDQEGNIKPDKELLANCNSLIRRGLREDRNERDHQTEETTRTNGHHPPGALRAGGTLEPFEKTNLETEAVKTDPSHHKTR